VQSYSDSRRSLAQHLDDALGRAERDGRTVVVYVASFLGLGALWQRAGREAVQALMIELRELLLVEAPAGTEIEQLGEFEIGMFFDGDAIDARALRRRIGAKLPIAFDLGREQVLQAAAWTVGPDPEIANGDLLWDTGIRAGRARSNILHASMDASVGRDPQLEVLIPRLLDHMFEAYGVDANAIELGDRVWAKPALPDGPPEMAWSLWTGSRSIGRVLQWGVTRPPHRTVLEEGLLAVAVAIERALAVEETEHRARRDSLTCLLNRDGLAREMAEVERPCAVGIVDIDHFKDINDRYGHRIGDRMLIALADLFRLGGRSVDLVARWGGEELVVVMPGATAEGAAAAIRRLLADAQATITADDVGLTFSAGVVELVEDGVDAFEAAVNAADVAMYEAKRAGRARVVVGLANR
jgi:diguanylate cyclase (GGDEF)-like protein